eukprot:gb/GEZN01000718.1/.p1 GENE.gb/GEZN01000718.1/~~gb/GEZN01000718.1/.p1  ORF type:complete len:693 (-),score=118.05 gb/GEZN01000718.1/:372-2450(-)
MDDLIFNMDDEFTPKAGGGSDLQDLDGISAFSPPNDLGLSAAMTDMSAQAPMESQDSFEPTLGTSVAQIEIMVSSSPTTTEFPFLEMRLNGQADASKPPQSYPRPREKPINLDFLGDADQPMMESSATSQGATQQDSRSQLSRQMDELKLVEPGAEMHKPMTRGKDSTPTHTSRNLGQGMQDDMDFMGGSSSQATHHGHNGQHLHNGHREMQSSAMDEPHHSGAGGADGHPFNKTSLARTPQMGGLASALQKQRMVAAGRDYSKKELIRIGPDDFQLLKVIGRGAYGKVFLVRKKATSVLYAMKVLRKKDIIQKKVVGHTKSERSVLETIQHPFFVQLRYAFQTPSKLYLILDYVPGGELFTRLDEEVEFSEQVAAFYAAEVVLALEHLHTLNIIYRDLKPENILLDQEGHIRLTDFGFAKADIKSNHESTTFCGTIHYMAPEIITNSGHGKAADWWALGVLIYEMVTGKTPFYASNRKGIQKKILNAPLKFPKWMTNYCQHLIKELLQRPVQKRMGTRAGVEEIKRHQFFRSIDWVKLAKKEVEAPFKPTFADKLDTSHFDEEFTSENPVDSPAASPSPSLLRGGASQLSSTPLFNGFSYYGNSPSAALHGRSLASGRSPMKGGPGSRMGTSVDMFPLPQLEQHARGGREEADDSLSPRGASPLGADFEAFLPGSYANARNRLPNPPSHRQ